MIDFAVGEDRLSSKMSETLAIESAPLGEQTGWRSGQDLIDALPYIDTLSVEMKDEVDRLVNEEVKPW